MTSAREEGCTVHFGDVVVYRNRQSLDRRDLIGFVIGRGDDGKMLVFWVRKGGRMKTDYHEDTMLIVMSKASTTWAGSEEAGYGTALLAEQALPAHLRKLG